MLHYSRYNKTMKIVVMLGPSEKSNKVEVHVPSPDCSVGDVITQLRLELIPPVPKVLHWATLSGSEVFLSLHPNGPVRLNESLRLSDYQILDDCTLWLMCSHLKEEDGTENVRKTEKQSP